MGFTFEKAVVYIDPKSYDFHYLTNLIATFHLANFADNTNKWSFSIAFNVLSNQNYRQNIGTWFELN